MITIIGQIIMMKTKLTILNQQDRNTGLAGDWGYGCTDDGVYQRMDGM